MKGTQTQSQDTLLKQTQNIIQNNSMRNGNLVTQQQ